MTCIVGMVDPITQKVILGGDSVAVDSSNMGVYRRKEVKVFKKDAFVIGFSGSFRMGQLLRHTFDPPIHLPIHTTLEYMVKIFVPEVKKCFKNEGFMEVVNQRESGGLFLVGYMGELFRVDYDFHVGVPLDGYTAIGMGEEIAHGALYAQVNTPIKIPVEDKIITALSACEEFCGGVKAPFTIVKES